MKEGYYWFREAHGTQLHMLYVDKSQRVKDLTGRLPRIRIRGDYYVDDFKGIWWRIEEPDSCWMEPDHVD